MGMFNFFSDGGHKVFDYKPVYYDKEADERRRIFSKADGRGAVEKGKDYVPGSYIKGAFRDGNYQSIRSHNSRIHTVMGIVSLLLVCVVLYFIAKFYSLL